MEKNNDKDVFDEIRKSENRVLDIDELAQVTGGKDVVIDEYNKKKRPPKIDP